MPGHLARRQVDVDAPMPIWRPTFDGRPGGSCAISQLQGRASHEGDALVTFKICAILLHYDLRIEVAHSDDYLLLTMNFSPQLGRLSNHEITKRVAHLTPPRSDLTMSH